MKFFLFTLLVSLSCSSLSVASDMKWKDGRDSCPELTGTYEIESCDFSKVTKKTSPYVGLRISGDSPLVSDRAEDFARTIKITQEGCEKFFFYTRYSNQPIGTLVSEFSEAKIERTNQNSYPKTKVRVTRDSITTRKRYHGGPLISRFGTVYENGYLAIDTLTKNEADQSLTLVNTVQHKKFGFSVGKKSEKSCRLKKIN